MGTNRDKQSKARMEVFESSSRERLTAVARAREGERGRERGCLERNFETHGALEAHKFAHTASLETRARALSLSC